MKLRKFVIVSDIHGDQMDEGACDGALAFTKEYNPEIRVIAGDLWDFSAIRRGATADERSASMRADYEAGKGFAEAFLKGGKQNHLMLGNHDVRAFDLAESTDAVQADLGERMVADINGLARRLNAKLLPYDARDGVLEIGHLNVVHGFHTGPSACAQHGRIYGNVAFGHGHGIAAYQVPGLKQKEARMLGCLCKLDMDYANRKTGKLVWAHGFGYGWVYDDGDYVLNQARRIGGRFHASTEIKAY